jgi:hypothetical protein
MEGFMRASVAGIVWLYCCMLVTPGWANAIRLTSKGEPSCLSAAEEAASDFPATSDDTGPAGLPPNPELAPPSPEVIRSAIEAGFVRIPRKGSWFRSYTAAKPARIFDAPTSKGLELGRIEPRSRLPLAGYASFKGSGCREGWLRLGLSAWVCLSAFAPDKELPTLDLLPLIPENSLLPGQYAYVRLGGAPWYPSREAAKQKKPGGTHPAGFYLQFKRFVKIDGINYWKTDKNQYVPIDQIARHIPSTFSGVPVDASRRLPLAFPVRKGKNRENLPIPVYDRPGGSVIGQAEPRAPLSILGEKKVGRSTFYRVEACRWIAERDVAAAFTTSVPAGVRKGEKWLDINLSRQTLVAYVENRPVYATAISSGKDGYQTKSGIFRIYWKVTETDMKNEVGADEQYLASSVPWSMFFWKGQALHGAYWHDDFGIPKSHGCVNLAPLDARYLFEWASPSIPVGAAYVWSGENRPGIVVQIRNDDNDSPMVFGYARSFVPADRMQAMDQAWEKKLAAQSLEALAAFEKEKNETTADMKSPATPPASPASNPARSRRDAPAPQKAPAVMKNARR